MTVEGVSQESTGYPTHRHFLYADYSPLDDNRNVIEMLKDFVSLAGRLIQLQTNNEKLASTLHSSDSLRQDVMSAIEQIRTSTAGAMDWFHNEHRDALATELHTASAALLDDARKTISELLGSTEGGFDEQHKKYTGNILSRISDNHIAAASLMQHWLSGGYKNFPISMLSSLSTEITVFIDPTSSPKTYTVYRDTSSNAQGTKDAGQKREKNPLRLNYKLRIDTSEIEFWHSSRKIFEFGIKELMLPIGMKAPISEKFKQAFRFGSSKFNGPVKEPEFVKVDDYYLLSTKLDGEKTLSIKLVPDVAKAETDIIEIIYNVSDLPSSYLQPANSDVLPAGTRPMINYTSKENSQYVEGTDLLQIKEIVQASDLSKIGFLGTAILEKLRILQDPSFVDSRGRLELLKADDKHILLSDGIMKVEFRLLFELLNSIASSFTPFVKRLKEKTPVKGELILREEVEKGQRKEYTVKLDDLKSQLLATHYSGKTVSDILQL